MSEEKKTHRSLELVERGAGWNAGFAVKKNGTIIEINGDIEKAANSFAYYAGYHLPNSVLSKLATESMLKGPKGSCL